MNDAGAFGIALATFALAGAVKGVAGLGLPTVAMGLLGLVMTPVEAAALMVAPSLVTNVWQALAGRALARLARRLWPMLVGIGAATPVTIAFLASESARWPSLALGAVLATYAAWGLAMPAIAIPARAQVWAAPVVGAATGLLTGATGVFAVPAVPYLGAIGLDRDELVQALGLGFTVSTIALAASLAATTGHLASAAPLSVVATAAALVGMAVGQALRDRLDPPVFRRVFLWALLGVGAAMIVRAA